MQFYFVTSSVRKSVWTFVRQLRGTSTEIAGFGFDSVGRARRRTRSRRLSGNRQTQRPQVRESCRPFPRLFLLLRRVRFAAEDDFDAVYIAGLGQRNGVGIN